MVDIGAELRPLRGHPALPPPPSLEEIQAGAQRRRARRRGGIAALTIAVVALGGVLARDAPERTDSEEVSSTVADRSRSTEPPTLRPVARQARTAAPPTTAAAAPAPEPTTAAPPAPTAPPDGAPGPPAVPPVNPTRTSTIEDTDIGVGLGQVSYSGDSWTRCGGCNIATGDSSYHYGYRAGQSYTLRFRGVQLTLFAPNDLHGGVASVTVDGQPAATPRVDFLTSGTPVNGLRWDSGILPDGEHTVVFTILSGRVDNVALFDHADVYTP